MAFVWRLVRGRFTTVPYPEENCSGRTVIITGANSGLGREASRHFARLGAAKIIIGCRNLDKGEEAKKDIEETTVKKGVVEVWQLDLASFDSVREFGARVDKLERVDILIDNASFLTFKRQLLEGHESMLTVNVISTYLLTVLVLPSLRRTASKFNITPHIVVVSSDAAFLSPLPERKEDNIFKALDAKSDVMERYNITKLLQVMLMSQLAQAVDASGKGHIILNALHPGLCGTHLFDGVPFPFNLIFQLALAVLSRSAEMGSRTLVAAALAGEETHGGFMSDAKVHPVPKIMQGEEGEKLSKRVWEELLEILEGIEVGVTKNI
ncbi:enoyl- hydratase isomerase [Fusarium albosuccineum]|uniref:Enoyl- hydratase isomerase n=1 Tax=Fusarium albosuccineum TaxID=1237068 RepID=A0A8H4LG31_9HYPO|nr:enoyl- hydratase isomerase [Fusarium albosuccineum]